MSVSPKNCFFFFLAPDDLCHPLYWWIILSFKPCSVFYLHPTQPGLAFIPASTNPSAYPIFLLAPPLPQSHSYFYRSNHISRNVFPAGALSTPLPRSHYMRSHLAPVDTCFSTLVPVHMVFLAPMHTPGGNPGTSGHNTTDNPPPPSAIFW
jgi:hypothetical protein